jgi:protein-export membrane protein SecD
MKNMGFRFGVVAAVLALTVYFLLPSINFYSKSEAEQEDIRMDSPAKLKRILNLGLDLQGGMRLVLEVDSSKLETFDKDVIDRAYAIIENRINQLGVAEPSLQKQGRNRIIVELPGIKDEKAAKDIIGKTAQLEFNLVCESADRERAFTIIENIVSGKGEAVKDSAGEAQAGDDKSEAEQKHAESVFGSSDAAADSSKAESGKADPFAAAGSFRALIEYMGDMPVVKTENIRKVNEIINRDDVRKALSMSRLGGNMFLWGQGSISQDQNYKYLYYVKAAPEMKGDMIKDAQYSIEQGGLNSGQAKVNMEMNASGAEHFKRVSGNNIRRQLAIVLDSTVYSAPTIQSRISGGRAEITGRFTVEEAKGLAIILRAGALPAPVKIEEERIVGPSLGQDSIQKGVMAGLVGTAFIILFMLIYYKISGVIALFALLINMLVVLAVMAMVNATLTLPGIAGLILLVGMGIDANVLIIERIREEVAQGRTVKSAIEQGYQNALSAILDSNLTTIIVGFILMFYGTGPIRGFAVTLIIGITASLFTALYVSKLLMVWYYKKRTKLSI